MGTLTTKETTMQKKPATKKPPKLSTGKQTKPARARRDTPRGHHIAAAPQNQPTVTVAAKPRARARMRRATATAAQRRGADLVRYLRIHSKKPYAKRGEEAIRQLAIETAHLGRLELGEIATVGEPKSPTNDDPEGGGR